MGIAEIGRQHLIDAVAGGMDSCEVPAWRGDDGKAVRVYWRPLLGKEQQRVEKQGDKSTVEGVCMHVKTRAREANGDLIFQSCGISTMLHEFDYEVISNIFIKMSSKTESDEAIIKN